VEPKKEDHIKEDAMGERCSMHVEMGV